MAATVQMLAAGREPSHDFAARQDCASTEKSDSRNDLSRDTRRIKDDVLLRDRGREAKSGYDHEKAGAYAHQHMCPDASSPQQPFALEADQTAERGSRKQSFGCFPIRQQIH